MMLLMFFFSSLFSSVSQWAQRCEFKIAAHVQNSSLLTPSLSKGRNEIVSSSISHELVPHLVSLSWWVFWECWAMWRWSHAMPNLPPVSAFFHSLKASLHGSFTPNYSQAQVSDVLCNLFLFPEMHLKKFNNGKIPLFPFKLSLESSVYFIFWLCTRYLT